MNRNLTVIGAVAAGVLLLGGCQYQGADSLPLPGTQGHGPGSYTIHVELPNAENVVPNSAVRVNDVDSGTVTSLSAVDWHAEVTIRLNGDVHLPANAIAKVGQVSLLGAKTIELGPPANAAPEGRLRNGEVIPLNDAADYPTTEQVLAATAVFLNGSGLQQIQTITTQLNQALGGREGTVRDLLTQVNTFVSDLNQQKSQIVNAMTGLNNLSAQLDDQTGVIDHALDSISPALQVLNQQRTELISTLSAVGKFGTTADEVIDGTQQNLVGNLTALVPALQKIADAGTSLVNSLYLLPTLVFPVENIHRLFRGDYVNLFPTFDLTLGTLGRNLLSGTPAASLLQNVQDLLSGTATQHANPLTYPLQAGGQPPSARSAGSAASSSGSRSSSSTPSTPPSPSTGSGGLLGGLLGGPGQGGGQ
jgi:phospholipid/cholesterol/gamma-HCH transport system substrate-binding protein